MAMKFELSSEQQFYDISNNSQTAELCGRQYLHVVILGSAFQFDDFLKDSADVVAGDRLLFQIKFSGQQGGAFEQIHRLKYEIHVGRFFVEQSDVEQLYALPDGLHGAGDRLLRRDLFQRQLNFLSNFFS